MSEEHPTTPELMMEVVETLDFLGDEFPQFWSQARGEDEDKNVLSILESSLEFIQKTIQKPTVREYFANDSFADWKLAELYTNIESLLLEVFFTNQGNFQSPCHSFDESLYRHIANWLRLRFKVEIKRRSKPAKSKNPERDDWIVEQRNNNASNKEILWKLKKEHPEWDQIYTEQGIQNVYARRTTSGNLNTN